MRRWGFTLVIIGVLGFIYPLFGMRLRILSFLDKHQMYIASGIILIIGVVLAVLSFLTEKKAGPSNDNLSRERSEHNDQQNT